ncbi:Rieske (2Fe-2S) protein [Daejeonella rubra]|nr:Rieske 2Fe-2S domain-containing protein [Daejeonella rubra]
MNWIKIFPLSILSAEDFLKKIDISGKKLCVVKTEEKFYAIQNKCPHAGAELSNGWCTKGKIICPYHRQEFDLETGRGAPGQGNYVDTYPVEIKDDGVYVGISKPWWRFW